MGTYATEQKAQVNKATQEIRLHLSHRRMFVLENLRANGSR